MVQSAEERALSDPFPTSPPSGRRAVGVSLVSLALVGADLIAAKVVFGVEAWLVGARLGPLLALLLVQSTVSVVASSRAFRAGMPALGALGALAALAGLLAAAAVALLLAFGGLGTPPMSV